jgi:drug/metabolite transporter (DMT)-like permease
MSTQAGPKGTPQKTETARKGPLARIDPVTLGLLCSFASSVSYGLGTVIARKAVSEASPYITALIALLAGLVALTAFSAGNLAGDLKAAPKRTYLHLSLAGMFAVFGLVLLYVALTKAPVAVVAPVSSLTPMFALVLSHFFLQRLERITLKVIAGTILVVVGVALVSINSAIG